MEMRNIDLIKQTNNSAGVARVKHIGVLEGNSSVDVLEILGAPFATHSSTLAISSEFRWVPITELLLFFSMW